jgi:hypothetical protein
VNSNDQLAIIQREIYDARNGNGVEAVRLYAGTMISRLKDTLCTCTPEEMRSVQGEIKAYRDLIEVATKPPFDINE